MSKNCNADKNLLHDVLIDLYRGLYIIIGFHKRFLASFVYESIRWEFLERFVAEDSFINFCA